MRLLPPIHRFFQRRLMATTTTIAKLQLPRLPIFEALKSHPKSKPAIVHSGSGENFSYGELLADAARGREGLLELNGVLAGINGGGLGDLEEKRVAVLVENGYDYVVSMLSILASGGIAVPLCTSHPINEMSYVLTHSTPSTLLSSVKFKEKADELLKTNDHSINMNHSIVERHLPSSSPCRANENTAQEEDVELCSTNWLEDNGLPRGGKGALMIYTSGTTNLPKGVISTHSSLTAQAQSLVQAWELNSSDYFLNVLPLHHVHGVVNATLAPLFAGGTVEYLFPFNAGAVWGRLAAGGGKEDEEGKEGVSVFMAVPTIYSRLLKEFEGFVEKKKEGARRGVKALRLAVSGSAALPGSVKEKWKEVAGGEEGGGTILERYGMTEVGMALSHRLPLTDRPTNSVGWPLPLVSARLVSPTNAEIPPTTLNTPGEIQISGPTVFREYWNNPSATASEFTSDGWFKTGDTAVFGEGGAWYIIGRSSVDVIKTGGEKVSALEVERELLELPQIQEAAVVGIPDPQGWGEKVAAVVVLSGINNPESILTGGKKDGKEDKEWGVKEMRAELKKRVAVWKIPSVMVIVGELKRNVMGKGLSSFPPLILSIPPTYLPSPSLSPKQEEREVGDPKRMLMYACMESSE